MHNIQKVIVKRGRHFYIIVKIVLEQNSFAPSHVPNSYK